MKYEGSCYIAVVGSEAENGECRDSIEAIELEAGDARPKVYRGTKGYETRQAHLNNWYEKTEHPFILFLDGDMLFPPHTLKRLRSHGLPYVSGLYMRRRFAPIAPVWYEPFTGWPMMPFTGIPVTDQLYPLGASGWGCVLVHRDVVKAVKLVLKGEPEILEDDMDVMPYDLRNILDALRGLDFLTASGEYTAEEKFAIRENVERLTAEIQPLRGIKSPVVGSDIRFPYFAHRAGFQLYGDAGVQCGHMLNYPLVPNDYAAQPATHIRDIAISLQRQADAERKVIAEAVG